MGNDMITGEYWDIQIKLGSLKESLNWVVEEIRNCDMTDRKTIKYLFNRKSNLIKEIDLYTNKLKWL